MIQRETAEPVVRYLRALTYSGELSSAEVWELANWLNQQPEKTLENWPAKPLVKALQTAFAGSELTPAGMDELAHTIVAIEELWTETFPPSDEESAADEIQAGSSIIEEAKPEAPSIPIKAEMPSDGRSETFTVDLQHHTCACSEWMENRAAFPEGDYRRCCMHLARAFLSLARDHESLRRDPLFAEFIKDHTKRNEGADVDIAWHVVVVNGTRVLYGASPMTEWVKVYAQEDGQYKRLGYNRRKKRWSYGERPKEIAWQIESIFSQSQPQVLAGRS